MTLRMLTARDNSKFEQDVKFLQRLFGTSDEIKACAVVILGEKGKSNYRKNYVNPDSEKTLKIRSLNTTVLFYEHTRIDFTYLNICEYVTMVNEFSFTKGYKVDNYIYRPAELPYYLEDFIYNCVHKALNMLNINNENFFEKNFQRGGIMPLKEMKKHPEWKTKYIDDVNVKDMHMCKSCKNRAYSGCCPEYSSSNRKKIKMVIGWHPTIG